MRVVRHLIAASLLTTLVLGTWHIAAGSAAAVASVGDEPQEGGLRGMFQQMAAIGSVYDLSALRNLQRVDALIDQTYVDPQRIDFSKMFRSSLGAIEAQVPGALLDLDEKGERLQVEVGGYRTTLTVQKLSSFANLEAELRRVAAILEAHVDSKEVPFPEIEYAIINGVLATLDPHSVFLPPEGSKKMEEDNEGEFGGLGITINIEDGQLTIQYPLEDTPAKRAGLQANDKIIRIEGEETLNMDLEDAVSKMRGAPGTKITITVARESWDTPQDISLIRDRIKPAQVWGVALEGGVAYIRIDQFHGQVETQLDETLNRLTREAGGSLKGVVLDLRDNPGGYLHQAVAVVDRFLAKGVIVATVERNGKNREEKLAREPGTEPAYPMVVLMSGTSASASEIVAGALKNQERAIVIGERSFGKGSVQNLYPFSDESRLKLTVARYLTPGDHSIQSIGIPPDIALDASLVAPPVELKRKWANTDPNAKLMGNPRISLFRRDHYLEEADLEGALQSSEEAGAGPVYSLRYLEPDPAKEDEVRTDRKDVRRDFEVMFARDVLLAAQGSRRADVLRDAERVVNSRLKAEEERVEKAFKEQGINWSACSNPGSASVAMDLKVKGDGVLNPGNLEEVQLTVTNTGNVPLCRTVVKSKSGNDMLDGMEFYVGRLEPGQTRTDVRKIALEEGYPTEISGVDLKMVDVNGAELASGTSEVRSEGLALPRYAWSWTFDDKVGGDGDGIAEVGETVNVNVSATNVGAGPGGELVIAIKKGDGLGKCVVLKQGTFSIPNLAPGASGSGVLSFQVVAQAEELKDMPFELRITEKERYDYASIIKASFTAYYTQSETLHVPFDRAPAAGKRETPNIELTRVPELRVTDGRVTISGVATDEAGIRDVIIYQGDNKVAYADGGKGLKSVPFSATAELKDGNNLIVVLVRDVNGLTTTRAVDVYHPPVKTAAGAAAPATTPG